jgi:hypothetical protein
MSKPGLLSIPVTVIVVFPLLIANNVNQTLLLTTPSPQLKTGSLALVVAAIVVLAKVLLAQSDEAVEHVSCALAPIASTKRKQVK